MRSQLPLHFVPLRLAVLLLGFAGLLRASSPAAENSALEQARAATLTPYVGETGTGVDPSTLTGKVMCGYQGWFNCEGDGANRGWTHWTRAKGIPSPGNIKVDLWPDMSELAPEERFATAFRHADGRVAEVFSSYKTATVQRHFRWMEEYGIDGVFVQRFANGVNSPSFQQHNNTVLSQCRAGAHQHGRTYALMYDLTGVGAGKMDQVREDFRQLRTRMKLGTDRAYLDHRGKPLVAIWGIGFSDSRAYTLAESRELIEFIKNDPEVGGCSIMLGVPTYWREGQRDAVSDPALHEIIALADVVSPWTVGRYNSPEAVARHTEKVAKPDLAWCAERKLDYLPVVFPGFSWRNMYPDKTNAIPRLKGEFLWSQFQHALRAGATMVYVAMFDEVDEATAIFKCTNDVPVGEGVYFATYEGLPSDYYLRLTGAATRMLRGELPADSPKPTP